MKETPEAALPSDVAALLRADDGMESPLGSPGPLAAVGSSGASEAVRARVLNRVLGTVGAEGVPGDGVPGEVATAVGAQGAVVAAAALGLVFVVGALVSPGSGPSADEVIAGVPLVESEAGPSAKEARPAATRMKVVPGPAVTTSQLMTSARPSTAAPEAKPQPTAKPAQPTVKPSRSEARGAGAPAKATPRRTAERPAGKLPSAERGRVGNLAAERAMLDRARAALRTGDGAGALAAVRAHGKRFARGALAEERESLWVRVLLEGGDVEAGKRRAERFFKRFPRSIHRRAVERALGRAGR